jgi:ubiquinone/menaquinone biosynthesis C-methylase UbiE
VEVKQKTPAWLDESHPNFLRWEIARELSIERGKFVQSIINQNIQTKGLTILDLGSGEGGTSNVFSQDNFVVSFDLSIVRLQRQNGSDFTSTKVNGSALQLPFADNSFDLIIIQDVIEHLTDVNDFYSEVKRVLKSNGIIYISTPNKLSIFNFISDPHFGLPLISILKRESIKKYFLKIFRKDDYNRKDIAELLSLNQIKNLFNKEFEIFFYTKFSVQELFNGNKGIVWSDFHLKIIEFCKIIKLDRVLVKIANDKFGLINKYFTPTFYIILIKLT